MADDPGAQERQELRRIREALARPEPPRASRPPGAAAVIAPLVLTGRGLHVLLERRPPGDSPFAGQLSFPGGRLEAGDATPLAGALREAWEEVGVDPARWDVLGHLTDMDNHLGRRVIAYAGALTLEHVPPAPSSPQEVEELLLVPLGALLRPGEATPTAGGRDVPRAYRVVGFESRLFAERNYAMHYWRLEPLGRGAPAVLWGLTAELMARLMARAFGWAPPVAPRRVERREDALP